MILPIKLTQEHKISARIFLPEYGGSWNTQGQHYRGAFKASKNKFLKNSCSSKRGTPWFDKITQRKQNQNTFFKIYEVNQSLLVTLLGSTVKWLRDHLMVHHILFNRLIWGSRWMQEVGGWAMCRGSYCRALMSCLGTASAEFQVLSYHYFRFTLHPKS